MESITLGQIIADYWQVAFLYGIKILKDISINLNNIKVVLAVHETEINSLKNRRVTDSKA
jgi:hypothetical protein